MRWSLLGRLGLLPALLALAAASCASPPAPTEPTGPDPTVTITETFTNTIAQGEEKVHRFVAKPGVVRTTVVSVEPDAAPLFGTIVGLWDPVSGACIAVIMNENMAEGSELVGTARQEAELCLNVYDIGTLGEGDTITYQMTVAHQAAPASEAKLARSSATILSRLAQGRLAPAAGRLLDRRVLQPGRGRPPD